MIGRQRYLAGLRVAFPHLPTTVHYLYPIFGTVLKSETMKNLGEAPRISRQIHLLNLLKAEFHDPHQASELFDEFLEQETYNKSFCLRLLALARERTGVPWDIRRLAVLMLEHQIFRLQPHDLDDFDFLLTQLSLKQAPGLNQEIVSSALKEGYSTVDLRQFIPEFRRKLARLNRVHDKIRGRATPDSAFLDFIDLSRQPCKLSLARYLFTPDEIVDEILTQLQVTDGVKDVDTSEPPFVEDETRHAINLLPDFEAGILKRLSETSKIYWVSETTSSEINSLVEYPTTTVVLVIKPPGSDTEFEIKRAGRKGHHPLSVVYARDGYTVPPSHRLDGGSMQSLLRYEAQAASRLGDIYRLVHGTEAPITGYISRSTIYAVPVQRAESTTIRYFTDSRVFGNGFPEMRVAMKESVAAFRAEGYPSLPDLPGEFGLTAEFIGVAAPAQAILSGTSSFRLNKLATYLSSKGPQQHFNETSTVAYSTNDARRLADAILEEILGSYRPPDVQYQSHEQYLAAAFLVAENRARADRIYLSLIRQIAMLWGTMLAVRGYSRGESFVARNVGLKSFWDGGQWKVRIIFMDHDALVMPGPAQQDFHPHHAVPSMTMDERYIWGRSSPEIFSTSEAGYLRDIYRIGDELDAEGEVLARGVLKDAYKKTQHELLANQRLRSLFSPVFLDRLLVWDTLVRGSLQINPDTGASPTWKDEMRKMLAAKGYGDFRFSFDAQMEIIEQNRGFLERYSYLFDVDTEQECRTNRD